MNNKITSMVESYLEYKRSLGFQLIGEACYLRAFARYTEKINYTRSLTRKIAFQWCESGNNPSLICCIIKTIFSFLYDYSKESIAKDNCYL